MTALTSAEVLNYLKSKDEKKLQNLIKKASEVRDKYVGRQVYLRGLIEYTNICSRNCLYCGLRKSNHHIRRYHLDKDSIIDLAMEAQKQKMQSICLQAGEIRTKKEIDFLVRTVADIKEKSIAVDGKGLGITLSVGELSYHDYQLLFKAGAHRYLLRIETSDPELFQKLHPPEQEFSKRLECLYALKDIGYQVGTGVMIGLPEQTAEQLEADLAFFKRFDIDMIGMGPYMPHPETPLAAFTSAIQLDPYRTSLKMLALARILMPDINMVASTALQSIAADGLINGLLAGANIVMPVLTPPAERELYSIYQNKLYKSLQNTDREIKKAGCEPGYNHWGDPPHWYNRHSLSLGEDRI